MDGQNNEPKKGFHVVDRRFWAEEEAADAAAERTPEKPSYVRQLEQAIEEKDRQLRELSSKTRESLDDFENAKGRIQRDSGKDAERARRGVLVEMLEVLDNLERALSATEQGADPLAVLDGVLLVRDQFLAKLEGFSIQRIEALGQVFDPALHEALTVVPVDDKRLDGIVIGIIHDGYVIGEELLRPAAVAVARVEGVRL